MEKKTTNGRNGIHIHTQRAKLLGKRNTPRKKTKVRNEIYSHVQRSEIEDKKTPWTPQDLHTVLEKDYQ